MELIQIHPTKIVVKTGENNSKITYKYSNKQSKKTNHTIEYYHNTLKIYLKSSNNGFIWNTTILKVLI